MIVKNIIVSPSEGGKKKDQRTLPAESSVADFEGISLTLWYRLIATIISCREFFNLLADSGASGES